VAYWCRTKGMEMHLSSNPDLVVRRYIFVLYRNILIPSPITALLNIRHFWKFQTFFF